MDPGAGGSMARTVFPPRAPSDAALDPATLDQLRTTLQSPPPTEPGWAARLFGSAEPRDLMPELGWATGALQQGLTQMQGAERTRAEQAAALRAWNPRDPSTMPPMPMLEGLADVGTQFSGGLQSRGGAGYTPRIPIPKLNRPRLEKFYDLGQGKGHWYEGSPEAFVSTFGPDENLMRGYNAILSQQKSPTEQSRLAYQALRLLKAHGIGGLEQMPVMRTQKRELQAMADFADLNPKADLGQVLSPGSVKRRDYYHTFGGARDRPVIDRHMGDIIYPEGKFAEASGARYLDLYERASDLTNALASRRGVPGDRYQAAAWAAWREAKGLLKDNEPFAEILRRTGEASPDWQWLKAQGYLRGLSADGLRNLAVVLPLATTALVTGRGAGGDADADATPATATGGRQRMEP